MIILLAVVLVLLAAAYHLYKSDLFYTWIHHLQQDAHVRSMLTSIDFSLYDVILAQVHHFKQIRDVDSVNHQIVDKIQRFVGQHEKISPKVCRHAQLFLRERAKNVADEQVLKFPTMPLFVPFLHDPKTYVVCDMSMVKWVLSDVETFNRALTLRAFADIFHLDNVFTSESPALHDKLRAFFMKEIKAPTIQDVNAVLTKHIDPMIVTHTNSGKEEWFVVPEVEAMVLKAYSELFFGTLYFPHAEECCLLIKRIWQIKSLRGNITTSRYNPILYMDMKRLQKRLMHITNQVYVQNPEQLKKDTDTVFGRLYALYDNPIESRSENIWNVLIPLFETLSRTLLCALIELAHAPEVQEKLYQEILHENTRVKNLESYGGDLDTLLQHVWQETLRLLPPTANQTRIVTKENPLFEIGSKVSVSWNFFHLDPKVFPDANDFVPDRWIKKPADEMNEYEKALFAKQTLQYNPFSVGSQACVGRHYASLGGRLMLKRIIEQVKLEPLKSIRPIPIDRAFSRGPDVTTTLRMTRRKEE